MRRALTVAAVLVVAILVTTTPAAASHTTTVSEHTTDSDFEAGSYTNLTVSGTGDSAQLELRPGTTSDNVDRGADDNVLGDRSARSGIQVKTDDHRVHGLTANISSDTVGATTGYLLDSNGNVIESASIESNTASFSTELDANTTYHIAVDADGSQYQVAYNDFPGFPVTSTHLNITAGWYDGGTSSQNAYSIRDVDYDYNTSTDPASYTSASHDASDLDHGFANLDLDGVDATVEWQGYDGSSWTTVATSTYSTDGEKTDSLSGDYQKWRVVVDFQPTTTFGKANLSSEGVRFTASDPAIDESTASPNNEAVTTDPVELSIDVSDPDFATVQGDELQVDWYVNGELDGTTTTTSNGTVTHDVSSPLAGENTWHVEVTDSYGDTDATADDAFNFTTPSEITIRDESDPSNLVDNTTVEIHFYFEDEPTVIENRTATDGTVNMSGLPPDRQFVVVADADGYYPRRIYVESLFDQQDIYLLPDSKQAVEPTFQLVDYTGQFPEEHTVLLIQRGLDNGTGNVDWRTVQGDFFGGTGQFPAQLRYNVRHRLVLVNTQTGTRLVKGQYTPTTSDLHEVRVLSTEEIQLQNVETIASIGPDIRSLVGRNGTAITATIDAGDTTVDSWTVTARYETENTTDILYEESGTGAVDLSPTLNLSGRGGGQVNVTIEYTLSSGSTNTKTAIFTVRETYQNEYSLLSVLGSVTTLLPGQHVAQATSMLALVFTLLGTAGVASQIRPSTEGVGLIAVAFVSGFYAIGWLSRTTMFIAAVAWIAIAGLRRGL